MNGKLTAFLRANWGKILSISLAMLGAWFSLDATVKDHGKRIVKLEGESQEHHDFITRQDVLNKNVDEMNRKLDRLLFNGRRH